MKGFSLSINGGPELQRKFLALGPKGVQVGGAALYRAAEAIVTTSKEQYVPVLTGALRNSIQASSPKNEGNNVSVIISAGGAAASYALAVHETNKSYRHGRSWKYLEIPLKAATQDILRELGESVSDALGI